MYAIFIEKKYVHDTDTVLFKSEKTCCTRPHKSYSNVNYSPGRTIKRENNAAAILKRQTVHQFLQLCFCTGLDDALWKCVKDEGHIIRANSFAVARHTTRGYKT